MEIYHWLCICLLFSGVRLSSAECRDEYLDCETYKTYKLCDLFKGKCNKTCEICSDVKATAPPSVCSDDFLYCPLISNFCVGLHQKEMNQICCLTCSFRQQTDRRSFSPIRQSSPQWNVYSTCTQTCGTGSKYKVLQCADNNIDTCPKVYEACNNNPCPIVTCQQTYSVHNAYNEEYRYKDKSSCCKTVKGSTCGMKPEVLTSRILGGTKTSVKKWPWMVRLEAKFSRSESAGLCGGILLSNQSVITAAHCVYGFNPNQVTAFINYGENAQTEFTISQIIIHPTHNYPRADIAILQLANVPRLPTVQPLCLPLGEKVREDTKCIATGWGITSSDSTGYLPTTLMEVELNILPLGVCKEAYKNGPFANLINDESICAGNIAGVRDTCRGDSGGPLMCQRCSSCQWFLAGITSFGNKVCGKARTPGVYVNVLHFQKWILKKTGLSKGTVETEHSDCTR